MSSYILDKQLFLNDAVESVKSILVNDDLNYTRLDNGVRVEGKISLNGEYATKESVKPFNDYLDVDMFVPNELIDDFKNFRLLISKCDYNIVDDAITFHLKCDLQGEENVKEQFSLEKQIKSVIEDMKKEPNPFFSRFSNDLKDEDSKLLEKCLNGDFEGLEIISTSDSVESDASKKNRINDDEEIEVLSEDNKETRDEIFEEVKPIIDSSIDLESNVVSNEDDFFEDTMVESKVEEIVPVVEPKSKDEKDKMKDNEKLFRKENYVIFARYYKVKQGESYEDIALKNGMNTNDLLSCNNFKPIHEGALLLIKK